MADNAVDNSVVLVAIPDPDDPVWKLSSEKVPHMTLLYMKNQLQDPKSAIQFIRHVANTNLVDFGMYVDRRGILGPQKADVLFFDTAGAEYWANVRSYFLANPDIRRAYEAADQYDSWTPHLTMGYPETPARPDDRENPGIDWVHFNRIALWTGDYKGVEIPLKDAMIPADDLAMSDLMVAGRGYFEHYGVKGMKWGVIRERLSAAKNHPAAKFVAPSEDHRRAATVRSKAKIAGVHTLTNKDLQDVITRMNLEVNYKNLKQVEHEQSLVGKGKKWAGNFINDVLKDVAASWLKRPGSNFSGRTSGKVNVRSWTTGQDFARVVNGSATERKAIGS